MPSAHKENTVRSGNGVYLVAPLPSKTKKTMPHQLYIPNLSMGLFETALELLQRRAYPVYKKNIERREPPISHGESTPAGIAVLLIMTGLDHHLSRLKYLRDHASDARRPSYSLSPNDQKVVGKRLGASTLKQGLKKDTSLSMQERNSR